MHSSADLASPLLSPEQDVIIRVVETKPEANGYAGPYGCADNPFEAVGAPSPSIPAPCAADPFRNGTPSWGGAYGAVKVVVCLPLAALRLVLFGVVIAVGYLATRLALNGWKDKERPIPAWRSRIMWVTRICARCILFAFGYHWIKRVGKPASREVAPIVASNHVSYIDPIFFFYELFPTIVASESHDSLPFVGTIIRAMQVIYVDRFSAPSRKNAVNEIKRKASCNDFPRVLLFPEGTTTNGRFLISFQLGAFIPGFPVQPVIVRYPHVHFDQSWGNVPLAKLMLRMFTQFHNFMEVEYLPIVVPIVEKGDGAVQFAQRCSYAMAHALNVIQTPHSYGDMLILARASEVSKDSSGYMVEMARTESSLNITTSEALEFLDQFLSMNPDSSGRVKSHDFLARMGVNMNSLSEKVFGFFDIERKGSITFRQFLHVQASIRNQPLFQDICQGIFSAHRGEGAEHISTKQLINLIESVVPVIDHELLCGLFQSLDADDEQLLTIADFMACMRKNPQLIAFFPLPHLL